MRRGDIVVGSASGEYGKPRPYVIVQSDTLGEAPPSYLACPVTSDVQGHVFRLSIAPSETSGLRTPSEVMVEKLVALESARFRSVIGRCTEEQMEQLDARLTFVLGLRPSP